MYTTPRMIMPVTPAEVRRRASDEKVIILQDSMSKPTARTKCRSIHLRVKLDNDESSHLYHHAQIRVYGSRNDAKQYLLRLDSRLWMHCHCPYFLYYCEQAFWKVGASDLYDCIPGRRLPNGAKTKNGFPAQRNPNLVVYPCKHLYAALRRLMTIEKSQTKYTPFINKRSAYDGDYDTKLPPSYSDRVPTRS
jgi:hypothetical protein